ncbi:MAG: hypothetical protein ABMB14_14160, partial [Myxococcota bacterium]
MTLAALESDGWRELRWLVAGVVLSLGLHVSLAAGVSRIPDRGPPPPVWVEMAITEVQPVPEPPPPEPEPEPEPKPPPPEPETVD